MAEALSRVYIGKSEAPKVVEKKADTLYNRHMQEVFDVVAPEAVAERVEAAAAQSDIAVATAELLKQKSTAWQRYKAHHDMKRFVSELDTEWRGRELPHRLERVLLLSVIGGASYVMDYVGDTVALKTFLNDNRSALITLPKGRTFIDLNPANGNRDALKAGWEMLTDTVVGAFSDVSVREATNRSDVKFVSPLSDALSKIGNIVSTLALGDRQKKSVRIVNSLINPSTIETGFRSLATIPLGGALIERAYVAVNTVLAKGNGLLPLGFDVGVAMLTAKTKRMNEEVANRPPLAT